MRFAGVLFWCLSLASSAFAQAPVDGAGSRKQATAFAEAEVRRALRAA